MPGPQYRIFQKNDQDRRDGSILQWFEKSYRELQDLQSETLAVGQDVLDQIAHALGVANSALEGVEEVGALLETKSNTGHTHTVSDITDFPGGGLQSLVLPAALGDITVELPLLAHVLGVVYSGSCRFRLYRTSTGRSTDRSRLFTTPYLGGAELLYDYKAVAIETDLELPWHAALEGSSTVLYGNVEDTTGLNIELLYVRSAE